MNGIAKNQEQEQGQEPEQNEQDKGKSDDRINTEPDKQRQTRATVAPFPTCFTHRIRRIAAGVFDFIPPSTLKFNNH